MSTKNIKIKLYRLNHGKGLPIPNRMTAGSSGFDICAAIKNDVIIPAFERALIPTGFCLEIPKGYEAQVRSRSGLAIKNGIFVLNSPGTIDSDYRGEVKIILANFGKESFTVKRGDRIAQLVIMPVVKNVAFCEEENISNTPRGKGGFGHTGI